MSTARLSVIRTYEELAVNSWPALSVLCMDGWLLRSADGYSKRANSVLPLYSSELPLSEHIAFCEDYYARLGLDPVFKLTAASLPRKLDRELERLGYSRVEEVSVQRVALPLAEPVEQENEEPIVSFSAVDPWLKNYIKLNPKQSPHKKTIARLFELQTYPCYYATITEKGKAAAIGMVVIVGAHAAVYYIITAAAFRRRGFAGKLMRALLAKAAEAGAEEAFLQVLTDNEAAVSLYEKLGFQELYRQWYRVKSGDRNR
ncbi:GNAT family N-acetyltransferase [Gorillibacterium timonense]|uniref:GNAT family N-acetyltransferase n=1 Tax=Gorillibacterium timonense TaxID=1689269 RepID=UPI00071CB243|nr:GNAT family N-acetyltransferase [Gorillibacterium timonense]